MLIFLARIVRDERKNAKFRIFLGKITIRSLFSCFPLAPLKCEITIWLSLRSLQTLQKNYFWFSNGCLPTQLLKIWFPKVNGPVLLKERWRKGFWFFSTPKVVGHNRVPSNHSYHCVTEPLMRYTLEKLFGCCFFNKGLIRHLIIWKTLPFKALSQIWFPKVNGPVLLKERWRKGFCFFSTPKVAGHNRVPSKHSYYWVTEPLMRYTLERLFGCCF